jgi:hypothetical protein
MNGETVTILVGILVISLNVFIFLAAIMAKNRKDNEPLTGSIFSGPERGDATVPADTRITCFEGCMSQHRWNVDQTSLCASECKPRVRPKRLNFLLTGFRKRRIRHGPSPLAHSATP